MASLLTGTKNTRAINGSLKYVRSDAICELAEEDIAWLIQNNITTIVDLRTPEEVDRKPCCLRHLPEFQYRNMPVSGGNAVPESPQTVAASYFNMVDGAMRDILDYIESAKTNVLYFCTAGKDRTGVVSALLLLRQNAAPEYIIADYVLSHVNLKDLLEICYRDHPEIDRDVFTPKAAYMEEFLRGVNDLAVNRV